MNQVTGDDVGAALAGLDALVGAVRSSEASAALAAAIARRDTLLWAQRDGEAHDIHDLIAREAGLATSSAGSAAQTRARDAVMLQHLGAVQVALAQIGIGVDSGPVHVTPTIGAAAEYLRVRAHYGDTPERTDDAATRRANSDARGNESHLARELAMVADRTRALVGRLLALDVQDRAHIDALGKAASSSRRVHLAMQRWPISSVERAMAASGLRVQATTSALHRLRGMGVVREITRRHRRRLYVYDDYIAILTDDIAAWRSSPEVTGS